MLPDSAHIRETEVEHLNRRNAQRGRPAVSPIYTQQDAAACMTEFRPVEFGQWIVVTSGIRARLEPTRASIQELWFASSVRGEEAFLLMPVLSRWINLIPALLLSAMLVVAGATASMDGEGIAADLFDSHQAADDHGPCPHDQAGEGCCSAAHCVGPGLVAGEGLYFLSAPGTERLLYVSSALLSAERYGLDRPPKA